MIKQKFEVRGMSCAACSAAVERAVKKLDGVSMVEVNLLKNEMSVEYNEELLSAQQIAAAVKKAGYKAIIGKNGAQNGGKNVAQNDALHGAQNGDRKDFAKSNGDGKNEAKTRFGFLDEESKNKLKELIISAVFLLWIMYFSMGNMMWGFPAPAVFDHMKNPAGYALIQLVLLVPILYIYRRYFISGFKKLFRGAPNMDTLISIGAFVSVVYGVASIFVITFAQSKIIGGGLTAEQISGYKSIIKTYHDNLYFESAGMILTLVSLGKFLEGISKRRTTRAIEALYDLAPKRAVIKTADGETEVGVEQVAVGDVLIVRSGCAVPVDGTVISGSCSVDQSNITGESMPVEKTAGDELYASTVVTAGYIEMRASKVGEDTSFSQIIKLVDEASASKAPVSRLADKISGVFVPVILIISLLTLAGNLLAGESFELALNFAVTVVVIACPCALGLATPVAVMAGTGKGAELGIIVKNAEILEKAHLIDTVVFDKTGTITEGAPRVTDFICPDSEKEVLDAVYSLELMSEHPLAQAICRYAEDRGAQKKNVTDYLSVKGRGICGALDGAVYKVGNLKYAEDCLNGELTLAQSELLKTAQALSSDGKTTLYIIKDSAPIGLISARDEVKPSAKDAVNQLIARHIRTIMLTGDNKNAALAVAKKVGITEVISDVLPEEKQQLVKNLRGEGKVVAMVGDGVNDAPALTAADIGIAMGGGSDIAKEAGDIVLLKKDLGGVALSVDLSKRVLKTIKLGLFWAFFYNCICVFIATGIPYLLWGFKISPMIGALAMSFSSVSVVLNALTINNFGKKQSRSRSRSRSRFRSRRSAR